MQKQLESLHLPISQTQEHLEIVQAPSNKICILFRPSHFPSRSKKLASQPLINHAEDQIHSGKQYLKHLDEQWNQIEATIKRYNGLLFNFSLLKECINETNNDYFKQPYKWTHDTWNRLLGYSYSGTDTLDYGKPCSADMSININADVDQIIQDVADLVQLQEAEDGE